MQFQCWIDEEKKNMNHSDVEKENKEIDGSDNNIVNNSNSKEDNEI